MEKIFPTFHYTFILHTAIHFAFSADAIWPLARKGPVLVLSILLATPYGLEYDLTLLTLALPGGAGAWQRRSFTEEMWLMGLWMAFCHKTTLVKDFYLPYYVPLWLGMLWFALYVHRNPARVESSKGSLAA